MERMNTKMTVIVPVYNVEKYLERCVESLIHQTQKEIQIILVDDGSTDKSSFICDEYAKKDSRILVIHKKNEGQGIARNHGLANALGEYVCFLDSDDYYESDTCEVLYKHLKDTNADLCCFGYQIDDKDGNLVRRPLVRKKIYRENEITEDFMLHYFGDLPEDDNLRGFSSCMSAFRISIIKENKLQFPSERKVLSEDTIFSLEFCKHADIVTTLPQVFYHYCQNAGSFSQGYREDKFEKTKILYSILKEYTKEFEIEEKVEIRLAMLIWVNLMACLKQETRRIPKCGRKEVFNKIKQMCKDEMIAKELPKLSNTSLPLQQKVLLFCIIHKLPRAAMEIAYIRAKIKL